MGVTIVCPLSVNVSSRTKFHLNLNHYHKAHPKKIYRAKMEFYRVMKDQVRSLPGWGRVSVRYSLFLDNGRRLDTPNVITVVDKFLMDCLVLNGKLPDDDYKHYLHGSWRCCGIDRGNGRVEVEFIDEDK